MAKRTPTPGIESHLLPNDVIRYSVSKPRLKSQGQGTHKAKAVAYARALAAKHGEYDLRYHDCYRTPIGKQFTFQHREDDLPVSNSWITVHIDREGLITDGTVSLVKRRRRAALSSSNARTGSKAAIGTCKATFKSKESQVELSCDPEEVCVQSPAGIVPAWKLVIRDNVRQQSRKFYVNRHSNTIVKEIPLIQRINGSGLVFQPNPVVALNRWDFSPASQLPDSVYTSQTLVGLDNSDRLAGEWVRIIRSDGSTLSKRANHVFDFKRDKSGFAEVMAYFHIDRAQRYIQSFGFNHLGDRQTFVDVAASSQDGSFYDPDFNVIRLGTGGVPDAEDAELILHEYGHAIQAHKIPGFGLEPLSEGYSSELAEGFCDYFAATFFEGAKSVELKPCLASWNALGGGSPNGSSTPPTLRRLDRNEIFTLASPNKREIWSSCLWKLRQDVLGRSAADRCILGAHYFLATPFPTAYEFARAIFRANRHFNEGDHESQLIEVFRSRAIFS